MEEGTQRARPVFFLPDWVDDKGCTKSKADFVKVSVEPEKKKNIQEFVDKNIEPGSIVNTDGGRSVIDIKNVNHDYQAVAGDQKVVDRWLPWVHKFISNAKSWVNGTHHGVPSKHLELYLSEYAYRFNRKHDHETLFHSALVACT